MQTGKQMKNDSVNRITIGTSFALSFPSSLSVSWSFVWIFLCKALWLMQLHWWLMCETDTGRQTGRQSHPGSSPLISLLTSNDLSSGRYVSGAVTEPRFASETDAGSTPLHISLSHELKGKLLPSLHEASIQCHSAQSRMHFLRVSVLDLNAFLCTLTMIRSNVATKSMC